MASDGCLRRFKEAETLRCNVSLQHPSKKEVSEFLKNSETSLLLLHSQQHFRL